MTSPYISYSLSSLGLGFRRCPLCLTQRQEILNLGVCPNLPQVIKIDQFGPAAWLHIFKEPQQAINIRCLFNLSQGAKSLEGTATLPSEALHKQRREPYPKAKTEIHSDAGDWSNTGREQPVEQRQRKTGGEWIQWMVVAHGNRLKEAVANHFVWSWLVTLWQSMQKTTYHRESKSCKICKL